MPRKYTKREPQFPVSDAPAADLLPPTPPAPNPAVIALQEDIVALIRSRAALRTQVSQAQASAVQAQTTFQLAQANLSAAEQEVQYLHAQIAQLEGRASAPAVPYLVPQVPGVVNLAGISSEPTRTDDMVNRGHASALRSAI